MDADWSLQGGIYGKSRIKEYSLHQVRQKINFVAIYLKVFRHSCFAACCFAANNTARYHVRQTLIHGLHSK